MQTDGFIMLSRLRNDPFAGHTKTVAGLRVWNVPADQRTSLSDRTPSRLKEEGLKVLA